MGVSQNRVGKDSTCYLAKFFCFSRLLDPSPLSSHQGINFSSWLLIVQFFPFSHTSTGPSLPFVIREVQHQIQVMQQYLFVFAAFNYPFNRVSFAKKNALLVKLVVQVFNQSLLSPHLCRHNVEMKSPHISI